MAILWFYWDYIGIILGLCIYRSYWGYVGVISWLYWGYIGIMENASGNYYNWSSDNDADLR